MTSYCDLTLNSLFCMPLLYLEGTYSSFFFQGLKTSLKRQERGTYEEEATLRGYKIHAEKYVNYYLFHDPLHASKHQIPFFTYHFYYQVLKVSTMF